MKKICMNCAHWHMGYHEVCHDPEPFEARECRSEKIVESGPDEFTRDGLQYSDCEGFSASLVTGPEFGCIHFEKMEDSK